MDMIDVAELMIIAAVAVAAYSAGYWFWLFC